MVFGNLHFFSHGIWKSSFFLRFFFVFEDFTLDVLPKSRKMIKNEENLQFSSFFLRFFLIFEDFAIDVFLQLMSCQNEEK